MMEAVIDESVLQRGSSWLESESHPFLLEDALENKDLAFDMLVRAYITSARCVKSESIPLHGAWNV